MKHLLSILLISTLFAGELEVDGDLNVTGTIQSQTIDSLLQVIQDLQSQLSALQGGFQSREFDYPITVYCGPGSEFYISLSDITGNNQITSSSLISVLSIDDVSTSNQVNISLTSVGGSIDIKIDDTYPVGFSLYNSTPTLLLNSSYTNLQGSTWSCEEQGYVDLTIKFLVTTQFPEFDVQQRKPGLQSKDKETVK